MTTYPQKITFGEMRVSGVRDVLIYCRITAASFATLQREDLNGIQHHASELFQDAR
jgi:hypothetical protein